MKNLFIHDCLKAIYTASDDFQGQKLPEKNYKLKVILGRFNLLKIGWASSNLAKPALIESKLGSWFESIASLKKSYSSFQTFAAKNFLLAYLKDLSCLTCFNKRKNLAFYNNNINVNKGICR